MKHSTPKKPSSPGAFRAAAKTLGSKDRATVVLAMFWLRGYKLVPLDAKDYQRVKRDLRRIGVCHPKKI